MYHKEFDYDVSPYSGDETLSNASVSDEMLSSCLPTVYSPTPSIPTITSPQSANTLQPEYFEVYKVAPIPAIDASISSATIPSFSFTLPPDKSPFASLRRKRKEKKEKAMTGLRVFEDDDDQSQATSVFVGSTKATKAPPDAADPQATTKRRLSIISHASCNCA